MVLVKENWDDVRKLTKATLETSEETILTEEYMSDETGR